jgi:urease accessory protein
MRTGLAVASGAKVLPVLSCAPMKQVKHRRAVSRRALIKNFPSQPASLTEDFTIWQLTDSSFPTGGFAHSSGLEAALQHGEIRGRSDLQSFVEASLDQLGHGSLPFVTAAFETPEKLVELDSLFDAFTTNHVANRASRAQGRAFLIAVRRIFESESSGAGPALAFNHLAPVFGRCLQSLKISRAITCRIFLFNHLRGLLASAVRLNIIGPMEAQVLQHRLVAKVDKVLKICDPLTLDDIAQTAPLLEVWQAAQDRLYSRLFQS